MGAWGGGLYDSDCARDLRSLIRAILRAPLSDDEILHEIGAPKPSSSDDSATWDHWLVLADQLERAGMPRREVIDRAIVIISAEEDLAALITLGADDAVLARRRKETAKLLQRLQSPRAAKQRRPLATPQPLLFDENEAIAWPTHKGRCINPYVTDEKLHKLGSFNQDGWGYGVVSAVGHHFGVLAYHSIQALRWFRAERPTVEDASRCPRSEHHYGTMGPEQLDRLKIERLGVLPPAALGPPQDPDTALRLSRKAALENIGLSEAFSWGALDRKVWPGPRFMFSAPLPATMTADGCARGDAFVDDDGEFPRLPPDRPATRAHYLSLLRGAR